MISVEVWFYSAPFSRLIKTGDWKGVLLRSHILWLGQRLTHCSIRIQTRDVDRIYMATWDGMQAYDTKDEKNKPVEIVEIDTDVCKVIDKITEIYTTSYHARVTLKNLLHMMRGQPELVDGMLCTSFVVEALGKIVLPDTLYPDNLFRLLSNPL